MSLLFGDRQARPSRRTEERVALPAYLFPRDDRGVTVTEDSARRHDTVWSCVTAIAQDVAMIIGCAFIEALTIYALIATILLMGKLG